MTKRVYKERRIYFSANCEKCGHPFQSFKRSKVKHGLCRTCRAKVINPDQVELFPDNKPIKSLNSSLNQISPSGPTGYIPCPQPSGPLSPNGPIV